MTIGGAGLKRRVAVVACVGFLLISSAGCAVERTPVQPSATPTAQPVFASDEEALAAATEAYEAYISTADQIVRDGGEDPTRIRDYVSDDLAESEIESYALLKERNLRGVGESSYSDFSLQRVSSDSSRSDVVTAYVCSDLSATDVLDESGQSVVALERQDRRPFELTFDVAEAGPPALVVASVTVWNGGGVCQ
jgi:hypothetical protein